MKFFSEITKLIQKESGIYISNDKISFLESRLRRRMQELTIETFEEYVDILKNPLIANSNEMDTLISSITTNVTSLFRESHHFSILFHWLRSKAKESEHPTFRIWSTCCSSGEEAMSIAITCLSALGPSALNRIRILATDIDLQILAAARKNQHDVKLHYEIYNNHKRHPLMNNLKPNDLAHAFSKICYMRHNIIEKLPIEDQFDIIFCRNALIYFNFKTQSTVKDLLCDNIKNKGVLFLGHSERLNNGSEFTLIGPTSYQRMIV